MDQQLNRHAYTLGYRHSTARVSNARGNPRMMTTIAAAMMIMIKFCIAAYAIHNTNAMELFLLLSTSRVPIHSCAVCFPN